MPQAKQRTIKISNHNTILNNSLTFRPLRWSYCACCRSYIFHSFLGWKCASNYRKKIWVEKLFFGGGGRWWLSIYLFFIVMFVLEFKRFYIDICNYKLGKMWRVLLLFTILIPGKKKCNFKFYFFYSEILYYKPNGILFYIFPLYAFIDRYLIWEAAKKMAGSLKD